jgi:hypothetical protein
MALTLDFTLAQSADCDTLTFTETTGDGTGGYGDAGNIAHTDVENSDLLITFPDGTTSRIDKGYTPDNATNPNGTETYSPSDFGYSTMPSGVWDVAFTVYAVDAAANNDLGGGVYNTISQGEVYKVTGIGTVTYNGITYNRNDVFTGVLGETTYTKTDSAVVSKREAVKECNFLLYCGVKECLKTLMLQRCGNECDCREDFHDAMNELIIDFNAAQLAFTAQNYQCANETIARLERACSGICNDCGC